MQLARWLELTIGLVAWTFVVSESFKFWTSTKSPDSSGAIGRKIMTFLLLLYTAAPAIHHAVLITREFNGVPPHIEAMPEKQAGETVPLKSVLLISP